jgi:hypothetical protein
MWPPLLYEFPKRGVFEKILDNGQSPIRDSFKYNTPPSEPFRIVLCHLIAITS